MTFITIDSGFCLSPTGDDCEGEGFNTIGPCDPNPFIRSGKYITVVNTCNMPVHITGLYNDNPTRFTIIDFPTFSGTGTTANPYDDSNPLTELPKLLQPYEEWEINTWWHPTLTDIETAEIGTRTSPTGSAYNARISVRPGDLGFLNCDNYFTISGEFLCEDCETMSTGLGTYFETLSDLPDPPIPDLCSNSSPLYSIHKTYVDLPALEANKVDGTYELAQVVTALASGRNREELKVGFGGVNANAKAILAAGVIDNTNNFFNSSTSLANSWKFGPGPGAFGVYKDSCWPVTSVCASGSGALGIGYTGVSYELSQEGGDPEVFGDMGQPFHFYYQTGVSGTSALVLNCFIVADVGGGLDGICEGDDPFSNSTIDYGEQATRFQDMYINGSVVNSETLTINANGRMTNAATAGLIINTMAWRDSNGTRLPIANAPDAASNAGLSLLADQASMSWRVGSAANANSIMCWDDNRGCGGDGAVFYEGGWAVSSKLEVTTVGGTIIRDINNFQHNNPELIGLTDVSITTNTLDAGGNFAFTMGHSSAGAGLPEFLLNATDIAPPIPKWVSSQWNDCANTQIWSAEVDGDMGLNVQTNGAFNPIVGRWRLTDAPEWLRDIMMDQAGDAYQDDLYLEYYDPTDDSEIITYQGQGQFRTDQFGLGYRLGCPGSDDTCAVGGGTEVVVMEVMNFEINPFGVKIYWDDWNNGIFHTVSTSGTYASTNC